MELFVFVVAAAMVLGGAVGVVVRSHPVHAALSLVLTLFGIAVLFIAQEAHFLAAVQVIVYAGAIVVLFLFVIMLLGVDNAEDLHVEPFKVQRPVASVVGAGLMVLIGTAIIVSRKAAVPASPQSQAVQDAALDPHDGNIKALARDLFSDHVLAFELTSVLLLGAVLFSIGVVGVMVRRNPLVLFMCVELMLNAVNLTFVALARRMGDIGGQTTVFFVMVVAAAEVVVGLGIVVAILRRQPNATTDDMAELKG